MPGRLDGRRRGVVRNGPGDARGVADVTNAAWTPATTRDNGCTKAEPGIWSEPLRAAVILAASGA